MHLENCIWALRSENTSIHPKYSFNEYTINFKLWRKQKMYIKTKRLELKKISDRV